MLSPLLGGLLIHIVRTYYLYVYVNFVKFGFRIQTQNSRPRNIL